MRGRRPKNRSRRSAKSTLALVLGNRERHASVSIGGSLLGHAQSPASSRLLVSRSRPNEGPALNTHAHETRKVGGGGKGSCEGHVVRPFLVLPLPNSLNKNGLRTVPGRLESLARLLIASGMAYRHSGRCLGRISRGGGKTGGQSWQRSRIEGEAPRKNRRGR